jgi:hypothetical protein
VTLISTLILDAFREGNILPLGRAPNANQQTEALRLFQQNIRAIYGDDAGEALVDWPLGTANVDEPGFIDPRTPYSIQRPTINSRLIAANTAALTVYLTPYPQDGARMGIADPFRPARGLPGHSRCQRPHD